MATLKDSIRKIAKTQELEKKIKKVELPIDRGTWEGSRGVGVRNNLPETICPLFYSTNPNSYDIADLLAGTVGPALGDECAKLNTITGLTDFDETAAGETVHLIIQLDEVFD